MITIRAAAYAAMLGVAGTGIVTLYASRDAAIEQVRVKAIEEVRVDGLEREKLNFESASTPGERAQAVRDALRIAATLDETQLREDIQAWLMEIRAWAR